MKNRSFEIRKGDISYTKDKEKRIFNENVFDERETKEMKSFEEHFDYIKKKQSENPNDLLKMEIFADGTWQIRIITHDAPSGFEEEIKNRKIEYGKVDTDWGIIGGGKLIEEEIEK